eukprot:11704797-Karenia_brevis.AAC.1
MLVVGRKKMTGLSRRMAALCRRLLPLHLSGAMVGRALDDMHLASAIGVKTAAIICTQAVTPARASPRRPPP